jgi:hypothetical protein
MSIFIQLIEMGTIQNQQPNTDERKKGGKKCIPCAHFTQHIEFGSSMEASTPALRSMVVGNREHMGARAGTEAGNAALLSDFRPLAALST